MILAGIDIGTNTFRLLIAEIGSGRFHEIRSERRITRLGQHLDRTGALSPEGRERSLSVLAEFSGIISEHAACRVAAVGTSALRNASNSRTFIEETKNKTGIDILVIPGEEEARLSLLGIQQALKDAGRGGTDPLSSALIIDIGGGSTEIIATHPGGEPVMVSLPLGAVYLTERFLRHDPPLREELARLSSVVAEELETAAARLRLAPASIFVGTAGTVTTLASIAQGLSEYDPARINRTVLTRAFIDDIVPMLAGMTIEQRRSIRGLDKGREDIILAGAIVTREIMKRFHYESMLVSDWGLREGIVFDLYDKIVKANHGQHLATEGTEGTKNEKR